MDSADVADGERFTRRARQAVAAAREEARKRGHPRIGSGHILLGLIADGDSMAARALVSLGVDLEAVRQQAGEAIGQGLEHPAGHVPFTSRAEKALELSQRSALQLGRARVGSGHLLLGVIGAGGVPARVLVPLGADASRVRVQVARLQAGG